MQTRNRKVESQSQDWELESGQARKGLPVFFLERYAMKNMLKDRLIVAVLIASVAAFLSVCVSSWIGYNKDRYYFSGTKESYLWGYDKNTGDFWLFDVKAEGCKWATRKNPLYDERVRRAIEEERNKQSD